MHASRERRLRALAAGIAGWAAISGPSAAPVRAAVSDGGGGAPPLTVAWYGEAVAHPGWLVGTEGVLGARGDAALVVLAEGGGYVHHRHSVGLMARGGIGLRLTSSAGPRFDLVAGVGYLHTFLGAPVYQAGDDGVPERVADPGRPHVMPFVAIGGGADLERPGIAPLALFARFEVFGQAPYNDGLLPHLALVAGATFTLAGGGR